MNFNFLASKYKVLNAESSTGSIDLDLSPLKDSKNTLNATVGSVHATFTGFSGTFDVKSNFGSAKVHGKSVHFDASKPNFPFGKKHLTGSVAGEGLGTVSAKTTTGSVKISFL